MSNYIIKIKNTSGEEGTIIPDVGFSYSDNLNSINQAIIKISGSSSAKRSLIEMGSIVNIYRGGTLEFKGLIDAVDYLAAGGMSIKASGWEIWLAKENGDYASSPWSATASATIFSAILAECSQPTGDPFTAGTVNAGTSIDFRSELTESLWNSISNLISKTSQDIGIDYINQEIDILDHKGSSTSVLTFNAGLQMDNIRITHSYPIGNDVRVYGEGEGTTRIISNTATAGQDATSKSNYGTIRKIVRDPSITTQAEANLLADALVAIYKDPVKIYDFDVLNPSQSVVAGDVITLNATAQGLSNEEVRVVGITKGVQGDREILTYQVTNKAYSQSVKKRDEILAQIEKNNRDNQTYNQYQSEYSNQNCATCIGGCACFTDALACLFGSCFTGSVANLLNLGLIGNGVCGCSGDWMYLNSNLSLPGHVLQACVLNINASSADNYIAGELIVTQNVLANTAPTLGCHLTNKTYVDTCVGGGASNMWADGDNPYIIPCNSCGLCMSDDIIDGASANCLGIASSPGAWKEVHALCISGATSVCSPIVHGSTLVCGGDVCAVDDVIAGDDICAGDLLLGSRLNINASSACTFYVSGNGIYLGTLEITYADTTCTCASRRMVLPVGVNCY